jgi:hypothetical protein
MLPTYKAILRNDHLEWQGDRPEATASGTEVEVYVTVLGAAPAAASEAERGRKMREALERIAARGTLAAEIPDPVAWQREIRKDRPLLGREDE